MQILIRFRIILCICQHVFNALKAFLTSLVTLILIRPKNQAGGGIGCPLVNKDPKMLRDTVICSRSQDRWPRVIGEFRPSDSGAGAHSTATPGFLMFLWPPTWKGTSGKERALEAKDPLVLWGKPSFLAKAQIHRPRKETSETMKTLGSEPAELGPVLGFPLTSYLILDMSFTFSEPQFPKKCHVSASQGDYRKSHTNFFSYSTV